jgi:diguanylate cyclase (GGDEF)-like protein/PAS domain S-box-containing protein
MKREPGRESELGNPGENNKKSSESGQDGPDSGSTGQEGQSGVPKAEAELEVILAKQSLELSKTISMLKEAIGGRSEAEKLARATQERFGQLCEITSDLVYIHDLSGKITSFNFAAEKITGYAREEAQKLNVADLIAPGYRDLIPLMLDPHRAEGTATSYRMELSSKDGRRVPVRITSRFVYWEGSPVGILGVATPSPEADPSHGSLRNHSAELIIRLEEETAELSRANALLREQVAIHERAEAQLRKRTRELEALLEERNAELSRSATLFKEEILARERSQEALKKAFDDFEERLRLRMGELAGLKESIRQEVTGRESAEAVLWKTTADFEVRQQQFQTEFLKTQELLREESTLRIAAEEALMNTSAQFKARLEELTSELSKANAALTELVSQHEQGEDALRKTFEDLEARIGEKSAELSRASETIQEEIARRERAEEALFRVRAEFERRLEEQSAELTKTAELLQAQSSLRELAEEGLERSKSEFDARLEEKVSLLRRAGEELKEEFTLRDHAEEELKSSLLELGRRLEEQKAELSIAGELLEAQSALREVAEERLEKAKAELEARVAEGVAQLATADELLKEEIRRREQAEEDLKKTAEEMEARLEDESDEIIKTNDLLKDRIVEQEQTQEALQKTVSDLQAQLSERTGELSKVKTILQEEVAALESAQESFDVTIGETEAAPREHAPETRDLLLLGDLGNLLRACASIDEAYRVIGRAAPQIFPNLNGALYVLNPSRKILGAVSHWGRLVPDERTFAAADCWGLRTGRVHWVDDTRAGLVCRHLQTPPPGEYVCVPMFSLGEILGVLHLSHPSKGNISLGTIRLASTVGEYLAMAMSHLRHAGSPAIEMLCDPLTGLFNRRFMEDSLELEIHRCAKNQGTLALILLDLDRFSFFNESFGQDVGDQLLREVARLLHASIREADLACRSGGAEFVLLMPGGTLEVALNRAQQLRESVKQLSVFQIGQTYGQVTVSIGVAAFPDSGHSEAEVLDAAEGALRQAKREGRDRVVVAR